MIHFFDTFLYHCAEVNLEMNPVILVILSTRQFPLSIKYCVIPVGVAVGHSLIE